MGTITAGNLCAFTIEASRRGKVDCDIDYGDADGVAELVGFLGPFSEPYDEGRYSVKIVKILPSPLSDDD